VPVFVRPELINATHHEGINLPPNHINSNFETLVELRFFALLNSFLLVAFYGQLKFELVLSSVNSFQGKNAFFRSKPL
jgi:hypothetical protein